MNPAEERDPDRTRDRNAAGRPRNARPRDTLGRPLPRGSAAGVPGIPDDLALPPDETLALAQQLLDDGRPFHAHEVLESAWKAAPEAERELWRGLAQLAVGITHVQRGNAVGAVELLRRASDRLEVYAPGAPHRLDAAGLVTWARRLGARVRDEGPDAAGRSGLVPTLRTSQATHRTDP